MSDAYTFFHVWCQYIFTCLIDFFIINAYTFIRVRCQYIFHCQMPIYFPLFDANAFAVPEVCTFFFCVWCLYIFPFFLFSDDCLFFLLDFLSFCSPWWSLFSLSFVNKLFYLPDVYSNTLTNIHVFISFLLWCLYNCASCDFHINDEISQQVS